MSLEEAVVVVAGAGGGAGAAVVRRLSSDGAIIVAADRALDTTEALVREIGEAGGQIDAYAVDLLDEDTTHKWADSVTSRFGRVDGVVHLVGGCAAARESPRPTSPTGTGCRACSYARCRTRTRAFHDQLKASPIGRFVLVSAGRGVAPDREERLICSRESGRRSVDPRRRRLLRRNGCCRHDRRRQALVTPQMREAKPDSAFKGYTTSSSSPTRSLACGTNRPQK